MGSLILDLEVGDRIRYLEDDLRWPDENGIERIAGPREDPERDSPVLCFRRGLSLTGNPGTGKFLFGEIHPQKLSREIEPSLPK